MSKNTDDEFPPKKLVGASGKEYTLVDNDKEVSSNLKAEMDKIQSMATFVVSMLQITDFEPYLSRISLAHAIMPITNPTAYMNTDLEASARYEKLIRKLEELQTWCKAEYPLGEL